MIFTFEKLNPYMNLLYFLIVSVLLYLSNNPLIVMVFFIMISLVRKLLCKEISNKSTKAFIFTALLIAIINPMVSHRGLTILFYVGYTPITLESVVYGIVAGVKLFTLLLLSSYFNLIMNYEKLSYVLSPMGNNLSLIISLSVKFMPEYMEKIKNIQNTQKTKGVILEDKNKIKVARSLTYILNAFFFITLEEGITTIKSIKARGYLERNRRSSMKSKLRPIDYGFMAIVTLFLSLNFIFSKELAYEIYPKIMMPTLGIKDIILMIIYGFFLGLPLWLALGEKFYLKHKDREKMDFYNSSLKER